MTPEQTCTRPLCQQRVGWGEGWGRGHSDVQCLMHANLSAAVYMLNCLKIAEIPDSDSVGQPTI